MKDAGKSRIFAQASANALYQIHKLQILLLILPVLVTRSRVSSEQEAVACSSSF